MSLAKFSRATAGYGSENTAASCGLARGPAWSDTAQPPSLLRKWTSLVCIPAKYEVCSSIASHLDRVSALVWARLQPERATSIGNELFMDISRDQLLISPPTTLFSNADRRTLVVARIHSSLKAPKDPPRPGGIRKLDLVRQAWELETLFIPSKAEVIVEWVLQYLLSSGNIQGRERVAVLPVFTHLLRALGTVPDLDFGGLGICDIVAGCLWEILGLFEAGHNNENLLLAILELSDIVVSAFESSFANYSNKKKIASILVDQHLDSWMRQTTRHSENSSISKFRHRLFEIGSSIIFTPEHTRTIFQHSDTHPVLLAIASSPRIFVTYVSALRAHKLSVFLDQNNSTGGLAKRIRAAARDIFVRSVAEREWSVVAQLVQSAEELQVVDDEWATDLGALVESAAHELNNEWSGTPEAIFLKEQVHIGVHVCSTLACILRLNFDVVEPFTERLLSGLCDAPRAVLAGAGAVFQLLLDYHSKARTLPNFLPRLASAGSPFVTPGQILPAPSELCPIWPATCDLLLSNEPPNLHGKKDARPREWDLGSMNPVRSMLHLHHVSLDVLSSLPVKTLKADVFEQLRICVDEFDAGVLSETVRALVDMEQLSWENQVVLAAALRIRYALHQSRSPVQSRHIPEHDVMAEEALMLNMIENDSISGELVTEIVRVLTQSQRPKEHICRVWDAALARVQRDADSQQDLSWNGSQLHIIESNLSVEQLKIILNLFVAMNRTAHGGSSVTSAGLFDKTVTLAQFWEMANIRRALNEKILQDTSSLDEADLHKALKAIRKGKVSKQAGSHDVAISMYYIAALAPPDYLDRSVKVALLSRGPCADVLATRLIDRAAVQVVLRQLSSGSAVALPEEYIRYLLDPQFQTIKEPPSSPQDADDVLLILTMSFRVYSRLAKDTGTPDDIVAILRAVETFQLFDLPYWDDPSTVISIRATLSLLNTILETWDTKSTLPDEIRACMVKILQQIYNRVEETQQAVSDLLIEVARSLRLCEQWLQLGPPIHAFSSYRQALICIADGTRTSRRARRFLRALLAQNSIASQTLLQLLTQEIQHAGEDVCLLIAAFTLNAQSRDIDTSLGVEDSFGDACRRISAEQHGNLTNEIVTLLSEPETNLSYRVATIRMASLAIRFAPEGTSKARRKSTTAALHALARLPLLVVFQEASAKFVAEICTDRANALTASDMAAIWILLDRATTSTEEIFLRTYSAIVASLNSLVRFRRDLLTPTLAQLEALLARLIRILRLRTSHALDAPQRSAESQATLSEKATELARLLVGLSTKTVVRLSGSNKPEQATKAESLARPFARHAPYLLVAYSESAADMSTAVRNALKPGLFALCVMCGIPARDMIMVTMLDTVGREVFGALWREWEAQKYTGKG
ncbi:Urb2/Npa2 family [Rhizoctonia solani]|uniref:Urb2/Npa2 family n=1 Tax=Rhizoctonia solani TaxID=456999 RepID=A0A8H7INF9_9AGAM|nr:Urb2/Npa2 family [Rhizoctonia solani]